MNNYLAKWLFIIEKDSKQLSIIPNDVILRITVIDQLETEIYSVAKTIKKFHIQSNLHLIDQQDFYKYSKKEIDDPFIEYFVPVMWNLDYHALIEECKQNIDDADYEIFLNQDVKLPSKKKTINHNN